MNAAEINERLCSEAENVVRHLFPSAKLSGAEMSVGDISGAPGDSLKIKISGAKVGFWGDFAGGGKGKTLLGLWCEVLGGDFKKAVSEAKAFLGVRDMTPEPKNFHGKAQSPKTECKDAKEVQDLKPGGAVLRYLTEVRLMTGDGLEKYQVGQNKDDSATCFRFMAEDGKDLEMVKYLALARNGGKKKIWTSAGATKILFGKQAVPINGGELFITEGEIDAISMWQMGYPAVSVPFGAKHEANGKDPNEEWIEADFEWLECFTRIYLCFDSDEAGKLAARSVAKRLGIERCFMVEMPQGCKDANEVLRNQMEPEMFEAVENAKTIDPAELKSAAEFKEQVWEKFVPSNDRQLGIPFFFPELKWRIRPGEMTIWTGFSGHGKSEVLNHLSIYLASCGQRICTASFEMPAATTLRNMTMQAAGTGAFTAQSKGEFDSIFGWIGHYFWIVDRVGRFLWRDLLAVFRYARRRYGVTQFVVDSLLRCGIPSDDYSQQKDFSDALVLFAQENECHVHLVAHSRKREDERAAPGKLDVKGSGDITDLGHNVISVYRNKSKESRMMDAGSDMERERIRREEPDGAIQMHKQRETGDEMRAKFWFHPGCRQFMNTEMGAPKRYAPETERQT